MYCCIWLTQFKITRLDTVLQIRDGLLPEDPVMGKYCSTVTPAPLQTTGPAAWIHFHSDFSVSDQGFHITYTTSPSKSFVRMCRHCWGTLPQLGHHLLVIPP